MGHGVTPDQRAALGSLTAIWPDRRVYVVGAAALVLRHRLPPGRTTLDLDLAVDVALGELRTALEAAPDWSADPRYEHRWSHVGGAIVDLLPIGGTALADGALVWPETGARMNLEGFQLLSAHSVRVPDLNVEAASAPLIAILKMVAWLDRPQERKKDLEDLGFLLDHYLDPLDERMFTGEAADLGFFDERANTYLLGLDMGRMGGGGAAVARFIRRVREDTTAQVALAQRWASIDDEDALLERIELFERGFLAGSED